jgi:hypothetical protein
MESKELVIKVYEIIGGADAISTGDGQSVFDRIHKAFQAGLIVKLDFQNIELIVSTFLNAAIGQLYGNYEESFIQAHIGVDNMTIEDQNLLRIVTRRAKEYFKNKAKMDEIISTTLGNDSED